MMSEQVFCKYCKGPLVSKSELVDHAHASCQNEIDSYEITYTPDNLEEFLHEHPLMLMCKASDQEMDEIDFANGYFSAINYHNDHNDLENEEEDRIELDFYFDKSGALNTAQILAPETLVKDVVSFLNRVPTLKKLWVEKGLSNYNLDLANLPYQLEELELSLHNHTTFSNVSLTVKRLCIYKSFNNNDYTGPCEFIQSIFNFFPNLSSCNLTIPGSPLPDEFKLLEDHIKELITNHSFTTISNTYNIVIKSYNDYINLLFTSKNP